MSIVLRHTAATHLARTLALVLSGLLAGPALAQTPFARPEITFGLGLIESLQHDAVGPRHTLYPEFEVSADFNPREEALFSFAVRLYAGGWTDGVGGIATRCTDCTIHSYSGLLTGARFSTTLEKALLPLTLDVGVARHLLFAEYVDGGVSGLPHAGIDRYPHADYRDAFMAFETGARLHVVAGKRLELGLGARTFVPLSPYDNRYRVRLAYGFTATLAP